MRINEIFYSLQGEGYFTGTPAIFVRFAGCNLRCPFCDTNHVPFTEMTPMEVVEEVKRYPARHVVITGGEPSLQLTEELVEELQVAGKFVAVETNGTHRLPRTVDWVTLSPKDAFVGEAAAQPVLPYCDELKVVFTGDPLPDYGHIEATHRFLQPCDTGDAARNREIVQGAVQYCLEHPAWRLSLQTHKVLDIR